MWNPYSNKWHYDEGTEWLGKGRWFLPIPGAGNKKGTLRASLIGACVFIVAYLLLTIWLSRPDYTYKKLPHFEMLYDMMGHRVTDVAPAVGVNPGDLIETSDGTYKLPEGEIYAGIAFETTLNFKDDALCGFTYTYGAPADTKQAAKDIANVAEMFSIESLITSYQTRVQMNEVLLLRYLDQFTENNQAFLVDDILDWTPEDHAYQNALATYLRRLESNPNWEGRVSGYLVKEACFYRQINMSYFPDTKWVSIQVQFFVDAEHD